MEHRTMIRAPHPDNCRCIYCAPDPPIVMRDVPDAGHPMTPQNETAKLIEAAKELVEELNKLIAFYNSVTSGMPADVKATRSGELAFGIWSNSKSNLEVVVKHINPLATALAAATEREKSWADHVLIASGGHAKTPLEAMEFIGSLRDMLDVAKGETKAATEREARYQELLADVWLYIDWRWVTKQLTTDQKELFADAVDADLNRSGDPDPKSDRWWRDDAAALSPAKPTEKNDE